MRYLIVRDLFVGTNIDGRGERVAKFSRKAEAGRPFEKSRPKAEAEAFRLRSFPGQRPEGTRSPVGRASVAR